MTECEVLEEKLNLYVCGVLSDSDKKTIVIHLKDCKACREEAAFLLKLKAAAKEEFAKPNPPAGQDIFSLIVSPTRLDSLLEPLKPAKPLFDVLKILRIPGRLIAQTQAQTQIN